SCVADKTVKVAALVPNVTADTWVKPVPVTVTAVPPALVPLAGLRPVMVGFARYVYRSAADVALVPLGVVTVPSTVPVPDGATAVAGVADVTENEVAFLVPKRTRVAPVNPAPLITTVVPPAFTPELGLMLETTGPDAT